MVNVTLSIPTEIKQKMDELTKINWNAVARTAFTEKIKDIEFIKKFKSKSSVTEEDALNWGAELNKSLAKIRHSK